MPLWPRHNGREAEAAAPVRESVPHPPPRPLAEIGLADLTGEAQVRNFITINDRLNAIVTGRGECYVESVQNTPDRFAAGLVRLVERKLGGAVFVPVTPLAMKRWHDANAPRSGAQVAEATREANKTVQYVIREAIRNNASDIYLDIGREASVLAFRVYGFKREVERFSRDEGYRLANGLWSQAEHSQYEKSAPCDTAFSLTHEGREYRVRGNSLKDVRGNSIVCRVRDPRFLLSLADSGYSPRQVEHIQRMCGAPGGLILITGETNSGKSTTQASLMAALPATQKIIEIADPCEVEFDHCTHIEINHYHEDADALFRKVLAATVRQNPDTLVLGEIRDLITAQAAMNMAIQGKRVLSTLHTQSCISAIPRLANLGVDEHLLSLREFVAGIVNQNLAPLVCPDCGLRTHPDRDTQARLQRLYQSDDLRFINPAGCEACHNGVTGQTLVAEVYPLWLDRAEKAHQLIAERQLYKLAAYMRDTHGVISKHSHAAGKIKAGLIDPVETARIIGAVTEADVRIAEDMTDVA